MTVLRKGAVLMKKRRVILRTTAGFAGFLDEERAWLALTPARNPGKLYRSLSEVWLFITSNLTSFRQTCQVFKEQLASGKCCFLPTQKSEDPLFCSLPLHVYR